MLASQEAQFLPFTLYTKQQCTVRQNTYKIGYASSFKSKKKSRKEKKIKKFDFQHNEVPVHSILMAHILSLPSKAPNPKSS